MTPSSSLSPGSLLNQLRQTTPLVHNITNHVAMTPTANTLLAIGASPLMAHAQQEIQEISAISAALSINIGTLSPSWIEAMQLAAMCAHRDGKPWVLDPVGIGASSLRQYACRALLEYRPSVIRANASEVLALVGEMNQGRGVDSGDDGEDAQERASRAAVALARAQNCVVAMTGRVDVVTDGQRQLTVQGGHALMGRVTAMGCALSSVVAAFLAASLATSLDGHDDALQATAAALACYAEAGETAGQSAQGPGSFVPRFMDALYTLDADSTLLASRLELTDVT
ncbi:MULTISPECIES: hydroxyethylthiazole kinase [unclassified Cobetia]|uniref:hydroxyethylthiazole kinase n=1 Tax=unclassified Cobetia TaxID=2609414 RepID=UPI0020968C7C|nr:MULTISPECIES: hydroxyethylthiazole kinase [unclassified Cobetia]MCO7230968.1 hydroxyethylthiazole kinase [Cobetia sp. Dlab-2-AX]MCO7234625.1 hydroxyethylthiazole kinase [Cobetia sp. Dlab-2-U]